MSSETEPNPLQKCQTRMTEKRKITFVVAVKTVEASLVLSLIAILVLVDCADMLCAPKKTQRAKQLNMYDEGMNEG